MATRQKKPEKEPEPEMQTAEARPRGRPKGTSGKNNSIYTERVWGSITAAQKRKLLKLVAQRKLKDESLSVRWGLTDVVREAIEEYLSRR